MRSIFLDFCSTTPIAAAFAKACFRFLANSLGIHRAHTGSAARRKRPSKDSRSNVASLLSCHPSEIIYTSGGTESINLALLGAALALNRDFPDRRLHLITTCLEHMAVRRCVEHLERMGWELLFCHAAPMA